MRTSWEYEGGERVGLILEGEIAEGRCSPPPSWSFGTVVVVVVVVVDVAAVVWVLIMSRQLQTKAGSSRMRKR